MRKIPWLEELLEVSALLAASAPLSSLDLRKFSPQGLGAAGLALRNAADMMLDEDWESAMGELEAGGYPLVNSPLVEMAIEIEDLPMRNGCFP